MYVTWITNKISRFWVKNNTISVEAAEVLWYGSLWIGVHGRMGEMEDLGEN
jgi:hypothetical protein